MSFIPFIFGKTWPHNKNFSFFYCCRSFIFHIINVNYFRAQLIFNNVCTRSKNKMKNRDRGLYILNPLFKGQNCLLKGLFYQNSGIMALWQSDIGKQQWVTGFHCVCSVVGWLIVYQLGTLSLSYSQYSQTIC